MRRPFILIVAMKLWLFALIEVSRALTFGWFNAAVFRRNFHFWPEPLASPVMYATWDAQHYLYLATHGYRDAELSMVFFPLWPALIHAASWNEMSALIVSLVLANAFSIAGLLLLWRYVRTLYDAATADATLVWLLAFPTAFYFCLPYTESLFLLLSVGCLQLLHHDKLTPARIIGAAVIALAAGLTRPVGICLSVPILCTLLTQRRYRWLPLALLPLSSLAIHRAIVGAFATRGSELSAFQGSFVNQQSTWNVFNVPRIVRALFAIDYWHTVTGSGMDRFFFVAVLGILLVKLRDKRLRALTLYALALAWVSGTAPLFTSFTRYTLLVFPAFIALADWSRTRRWMIVAYLLIALPLQLLLLIRHIHNYWVG